MGMVGKMERRGIEGRSDGRGRGGERHGEDNGNDEWNGRGEREWEVEEVMAYRTRKGPGEFMCIVKLNTSHACHMHVM